MDVLPVTNAPIVAIPADRSACLADGTCGKFHFAGGIAGFSGNRHIGCI
jgi:hypothetical protein